MGVTVCVWGVMRRKTRHDDDDRDITCEVSKCIILAVGFAAIFYLVYVLYYAETAWTD